MNEQAQATHFEVRAKEVPPKEGGSWAASAWRFVIISDSMHAYEGIYSAGSGHRYEGAEDPTLLDSIIWSAAQDLYSTSSNPESIEEIVKDLVHEGLAQVNEAFEVAEQLMHLNTWYHKLTGPETEQLRDIVEEN